MHEGESVSICTIFFQRVMLLFLLTNWHTEQLFVIQMLISTIYTDYSFHLVKELFLILTLLASDRILMKYIRDVNELSRRPNGVCFISDHLLHQNTATCRFYLPDNWNKLIQIQHRSNIQSSFQSSLWSISKLQCKTK